MLRWKKKKISFFESILKKDGPVIPYEKDEGLNFLVNFFGEIRPSRHKNLKDAEKNLRHAIAQLYEHPVLLQHLQSAIVSQLSSTHLTSAITESGIPHFTLGPYNSVDGFN